MWWMALLVGVPIAVGIAVLAGTAAAFTVGGRKAWALMDAYPADLPEVADDVWGALVAQRWTPADVAALGQVGRAGVFGEERARLIPTYLEQVAAGRMPGATARQHLTWMSVLLAAPADGPSEESVNVVAAAEEALPWILAFGDDLAPLVVAAGVPLAQAIALHKEGRLDVEVLHAQAGGRGVWLPDNLG